MTGDDFINRFKKHINIGGKNQVANADAALETCQSTYIL